jgi:hypothetical protein
MSANLTNRPAEPITGNPVESGFDAAMWRWSFCLDVALLALSTRLDYLIKRVAGGAGGTQNYEGPFAVVAKDGTTVTILGSNSEKNRLWSNTITLGLSKLELPEQDLSISSTGHVYLEIRYSSSYAAEAKAGVMPEQSDTKYYIPLAYVVVKDGAISSITQLQFGQVEGCGRIL